MANSRNDDLNKHSVPEKSEEGCFLSTSDQTCGDNHRSLSLSRKRGRGLLNIFEIGILGGTSHSFSDVHRNKYLGLGGTMSSITKDAGTAGGIYFSYRHVDHFGLSVGLTTINISGTAVSEDAGGINEDDLVAGFAFKNQIIEANGRLLFYAPIPSQRVFDLFAFVGLSIYYNFLELRDQNQLVTSPTEEFNKLQLALPFGIGASFRVGKSMSVGFESGYRYTPFNYLDGISPPDTRYDAFLLNQVKLGFFLN